MKLIRAQLTPLAETTLPEPQDLGAFWGSVERALLSLDPTFRGYKFDFREGHIDNLGPYILGAKGWAQLGNKSYRSWGMFEKEVEEVFGVTKDQMEEQFFALAPKPQESSPEFVLRIEMERRRLGVDKGSTFHAFVKKSLG